MLTTLYGETPSSRADYVESQLRLASATSQHWWKVAGRWFDFDRNEDGSYGVIEFGVPVGRIDSLDEADSFIDWITQ